VGGKKKKQHIKWWGLSQERTQCTVMGDVGCTVMGDVGARQNLSYKSSAFFALKGQSHEKVGEIRA
jgi:hypothetical protein